MENKPAIGILQAFICLTILGVMPVISNSRPGGLDALSFAFFLSAWQLLFSLPLVFYELNSTNKGIFTAALPPNLKRKTILIILLTGSIFGASTFLYVLAVEKAGTVSAAIAIQAYPLFAILWETVFLKRSKTPPELLLTFAILLALTYLATQGTWRIDGFSIWFVAALGIPFLWSIAHVIIREVLSHTPITPAQVTFFRVLVSSLFLGLVLFATNGAKGLTIAWSNFGFQKFALIMGLVYYIELIVWFHAMRHISVSLASTITVPWPAITMVFAILFLGEPVALYQLIAFAAVAASIYGLIYLDARKTRALTGATT